MRITKSQFVQAMYCEYGMQFVKPRDDDEEVEVRIPCVIEGRKVHEYLEYLQLNKQPLPKIDTKLEQNARKLITYLQRFAKPDETLIEEHLVSEILPIEGHPDRVDLYHDDRMTRAIVIEWKTTLPRHIDVEMHFYKLLVETSVADCVEAMYVGVVRTCEFIRIPYDVTLENRVVKRVFELIEKLERGDLAANRRFCSRCLYRDVCDKRKGTRNCDSQMRLFE